jgi:hypothetical protein
VPFDVLSCLLIKGGAAAAVMPFGSYAGGRVDFKRFSRRGGMAAPIVGNQRTAQKTSMEPWYSTTAPDQKRPFWHVFSLAAWPTSATVWGRRKTFALSAAGATRTVLAYTAIG